MVVSFLVMFLTGFYACYRWWVYVTKWQAAESRCIKLEAEISQLKAEVLELEYRSSR